MAFGGGTYIKYDKFLPGTYINTITVGAPASTSTRGVTAGGLVMDWGPDNELFEITATEFNENSVDLTGYPSTDDSNLPLREAFKHANTFIGYKLNSRGSQKAKNENIGTARYSGKAGNDITVTCYRNVNNESKYDVSTYFKGQLKDSQTVEETGIDEPVITKGSTTPGDTTVGIEKIQIEKHGFVKTNTELDSVVGAGESSQIDHDTNVFYVVFKEKPAKVTNYAVQFEVDDKTYLDVFGDYKYNYFGLGNGKSHNTDAKFVKDGDVWKAHDGTAVDVSGKTVKMSVVRYSQEPTLSVIQSETPTTIVEPTSINCASSVAKGAKTVSLGTAASVTFEIKDNQIIADIKNKPEDYYILATLIKGDVIYAFGPGRFELSERGDKRIVTVGQNCTTGEFKLVIKLSQYGVKGTTKTIGTQAFTLAYNEDAVVGADTNQLKENNFVTFAKNTVIPEGAGYVFKGGRSGSSVNAGSHSDFLNALESRTFNVIAYDGTDSSVKELYTAYTKRMRDDRGKYFQTVLYDYDEADYEGVVSVYNQVDTTNAPSTATQASLVWWVAGYSGAVALSNELTSKLYDGELKIDTSLPDSQLQLLTEQGNFLFHKVSESEIYSLFDVNTFTSYTTEKDSQLSENKVIRIIDYLHNSESYQINRIDVGQTPNTPEGRALIWNRCLDILNELQDAGAITDFTSDNLTIESVPGDRHAVKIDQSFSVVGTIYRVYITTYVVE